MPYPVISVIIPSFNRRELLKKCLDSLFNQDYPAEEYEIIVVDNHSSDGTLEMLKKYDVKVIQERGEMRCPANARNIGVQHARGEIIAFIDSDCEADRLWLSNMEKLHKKYGYEGIGGVIKNRQRHPIALAEYFLEFSEYIPDSKNEVVRLLPTCNASYKKEVFEKARFPLVRTAEDVLFNWELINQGCTLYRCSSMIIYHTQRTTLREFLKNQYLLGKGFTESRKREKLPGEILIKYPVLLPLKPLLHYLIILKRLCTSDVKNLFLLLLLTPLLFLGETWNLLGAISQLREVR